MPAPLPARRKRRRTAGPTWRPRSRPALLSWLRPFPLGLAAPLAFVTLEFLFPSLFPWRLGNSQYRVAALLQTGELAGPFLLGFAIVWVNAAVLAAARM